MRHIGRPLPPKSLNKVKASQTAHTPPGKALYYAVQVTSSGQSLQGPSLAKDTKEVTDDIRDSKDIVNWRLCRQHQVIRIDLKITR